MHQFNYSNSNRKCVAMAAILSGKNCAIVVVVDTLKAME